MDGKMFVSNYERPYSFYTRPPLPPPPPPPQTPATTSRQSHGFNLNYKVIAKVDSLLSDFTPNSSCSPIVLVLESGSVETSRESVSSDQPNSSSIQRVNSHLSNKDFEVDKGEVVKEDDDKEKVVTIKLGKYKNVDGGGEGSSEQTIDGRRCFSMGSFEYVMNENSNLQVPIRIQMKKQASKKSSLPITPSHRPAMSECGGDSRIDFKGIEVLGGGSSGGGGGNGKNKRESFSVSKIWLRGKKQKANSTIGAAIGRSSRGSFSFRFDGSKEHIRASSEMDIGRWDDDQEMQMRQWLDPPQLEASNPPSFARRSLFCLMGWQQIKVVHSSSSTNV
ncbi:hypothetical protein HanRHA438_Chr09g0383071 [Helianthus annuus]|nr:hypothetical protein HanRHA438_Chr09g0383071 [Helianthus annuus]